MGLWSFAELSVVEGFISVGSIVVEVFMEPILLSPGFLGCDLLCATCAFGGVVACDLLDSHSGQSGRCL